MIDRDIANRFLAFYRFGYKDYTPDLDTFMSRAMKDVNKMTEAEKEKCKKDFTNSMKLNKDVFGKHAFRKRERNWDGKKPLNKALFDVFSVVFAKLNEDERRILKEQKQQVSDGLIDLLENKNDFVAAITSSTSDKTRVITRFSMIETLVNTLVNKQK